MILAIDIGNTNITCGVYEDCKRLEKKAVCVFRLTSKQSRTSDEYGMLLLQIMQNNGIQTAKVRDVIISSVVPNIMHSFNSAVRNYLHTTPLVVGAGVKTGIKIVTGNPGEIGPDRIVDAAGALEKYGGPVLVLDFGTATTYDLIGSDGALLAGITAPGIGISAKALWEDTARLPEIEIKKPKSILAKDTVSSMQAGLVYGQIGQTEYIVSKVKEEAKLEGIKVVATGGLGRIIAQETIAIDVFDSTLTLDGLVSILHKNC